MVTESRKMKKCLRLLITTSVFLSDVVLALSSMCVPLHFYYMVMGDLHEVLISDIGHQTIIINPRPSSPLWWMVQIR